MEYVALVALLSAMLGRVVLGKALLDMPLPKVRLAALIVLAWLVQLAVFASPLSPALGPWVVPLHAVSLLLLGLVIVVNRRAPGVVLIGLGLALNVAVMSANAGFMPVSESALLAVGHSPDAVAQRAIAPMDKTFLMDDHTPLWMLGDVWPVPVTGRVYSLGDIVAGVGVFVFVLAAGSIPAAATRRAAA